MRHSAEQRRSFRDLLIVLALAIVLVLAVLLELDGFAAPIAVIASALLSTAGVFLAPRGSRPRTA